MEGDAAAAILQVLVENLIDQSKKEISLIRGLEKDAEKLIGSLDTIQKFLNDAEMRTIPGEAVKSWLNRLEDVAFDADNVLDELNYHLLSKKIKAVKPMKKKVLSCFSSFNHIARPRKMALKIKEINENLESINKDASAFGLVGRLADELIIRGCQDLKWIGYPSGGGLSQGSLASLRNLEICECPELMELPCEMVESSLETVSLEGLSSLKNLGRVIESLAKSPRLRELRIVGVPKFMATRVETWHFPSLQKLQIDVSMEWSRETVDGILQGCCHSLNWLTLKGSETWECLPESIQHLTASTSLQLSNFGVEELPEWFGNLSSLQTLYLSYCKKLRRLPSTDAMRCLVKLKELTIEGCPELHIEQSNDNSEWPKISHIPNVWTNESQNPMRFF